MPKRFEVKKKNCVRGDRKISRRNWMGICEIWNLNVGTYYQKKIFNNTYYTAFIRGIMEELHISLTPNKEHEKGISKCGSYRVSERKEP